MKENTLILIFLVALLILVNYDFLDSLLINLFNDEGITNIDRVIDGDTIVVGGVSVRLLGINSPERGEQYYEEAKEFLGSSILNKTIILKSGKEKQGRYGRTLAYVFVGGENINLKLVEEGLANFYFPSGKDVYYEKFLEAWKRCKKNLCKKSEDKCANCIELEKFDYEKEAVTFQNKCSFDCDMTGWKIKDEGRKNFVFPEFVLGSKKNVKVIVSKENATNNKAPQAYPETFQNGTSTKGKKLFWKRKTYVWTDSGDTLFLRDKEGELVLWESY